MKKNTWKKGLLLVLLTMAFLTICAGAEEIEDNSGSSREQYEETGQTNGTKEELTPVYFDDPYIDLYHGLNTEPEDEVILAGEDTEPSDPYEKMKWVLKQNIKLKYTPILIRNYTDKTMTVDDVAQLYYNTLYDYPEETYFARTGFYRYDTSYAPGEDIYIGPMYLDGLDDSLYQNRVSEAAEACFQSGMTPLEKVVSAHDWLVENCQYDPYVANGQNDYTTADGVTYSEDRKAYTSYGAFVDGNVVCQGYALAFKVLMDRADIPCCYVSNHGHAWNMVQLNGDWYHVDVTWDDPVNIGGTGDFAGSVSRNYFIKSDAEFQSNHSAWSTEYGYTTPIDSYDMPEALLNASCTAAYLIDDTFYLMSGGGELKKYQIGQEFNTGITVASIGAASKYISTYIRSAAYDEENKSLYYENIDEIFELNLKEITPTPRLLELQGSDDSWRGLRLRDSKTFPGAKELCTWYNYAAVDSILVGITSTATDMPVVIQFPSSMLKIENLAEKSISVKTNSLPDGITGGTVYLASYDEDEKMQKIVAIGNLSAGTLNIDSSYLTQDAAVVKILTVSNQGTPLATLIRCS